VEAKHATKASGYRVWRFRAEAGKKICAGRDLLAATEEFIVEGETDAISASGLRSGKEKEKKSKAK
jgi:hypothetical protein